MRHAADRMILCSRLAVFVVLIGSFCRATTAGATATDDRPTDVRPPLGEEEVDFGRGGPDPPVNRTLAQTLLRRTSDTVSKFLPFVTTADAHSQCFKHTAVYLTQLNDFQIWATKSEHCILYTYRYFAGHFIINTGGSRIKTIRMITKGTGIQNLPRSYGFPIKNLESI